eukprot:6214608-Pleurochrysis_carterae.AAC.1
MPSTCHGGGDGEGGASHICCSRRAGAIRHAKLLSRARGSRAAMNKRARVGAGDGRSEGGWPWLGVRLGMRSE